MSTIRYFQVDFGPAKTGLEAVGYQLYQAADGTPSGSRITAGVFEIAHGKYGAVVDVANCPIGCIEWDTGEASPLYAGEDYGASAAALLDHPDGVEAGKTVRQTLRILAAVVAGKVSGAGSGTETFRSLDDGADRVVVTADAAGNRTAVEYSS
ncbi:MAG: hypothetical protein JXB10_20720 [Pirellulales bacterium]|nr:hypothetical protein [Pirellulales bacterium]